MNTDATRYTRNGEIEIAHQDLGGTGGDPLLLVIGLGTTRFWWPPGFVDSLIAEGFHVAAYDHRDAGESARFPDTDRVHPLVALFRQHPAAYTAEDMTDDAIAVLERMGWESAHLFGHSMGGLLAQRIAIRHPDRVRSLVTSGAVPSDPKGMSTLRYVRAGFVVRMSRMSAPEGRDGDIALGVAVSRALSSPGYPYDEAAARVMAGRDAASPFRDTKAMSRQSGAKWSGGSLAEIRQPTLAIHRAADQVLRPTAARSIATAISGARQLTIPGLGHDLPRDLWSTFAHAVRTTASRANRLRGECPKCR